MLRQQRGGCLRHYTKLAGTLAVIVLTSTACSMPVFHRNFAGETGDKERILASMSFVEDDSTEDSTNLHFYKIRKGYALKAHLDRAEDREGDFVMLKNKEYDWFAGFQWKFTF